jgi:hypothetical protein
MRPFEFDSSTMPSVPAHDEHAPPPRGPRLRFELLFVSLWLAVGLFVVPALVYWVGSSELGPYGEKAGLSEFYGAYFADLASFTARTWLLALGPLILMSLVRLIYIGVPASRRAPPPASDDDEPPLKAPSAPAARRLEPRARVEPRVGS